MSLFILSTLFFLKYTYCIFCFSLFLFLNFSHHYSCLFFSWLSLMVLYFHMCFINFFLTLAAYFSWTVTYEIPWYMRFRKIFFDFVRDLKVPMKIDCFIYILIMIFFSGTQRGPRLFCAHMNSGLWFWILRTDFSFPLLWASFREGRTVNIFLVHLCTENANFWCPRIKSP